MPKTRYGFKGNIYVNTASFETPSWELVPEAKDIVLNIEADKTEGSDRGLFGFKGYLPTLVDMGVETEINYKKNDAETALTTMVELLRTRFFARAVIDLLVLDDLLVANSEGIRAGMALFKFPREAPMGGIMVVKLDFGLHLDAGFTPAWYKHPD